MIGDVLVRVGADITEYQRKMNQAGQTMQNFGGTMTAVSGSIAATFAGIATSTAFAVSSMVKVASDYESAFASVRKTVDATESQYAQLSKGIRDISKEIPMASTEIAELAGIVGQLGVKQEDVLKFTRTVADLGVTTNMSAEDAAMSLARFANITGMAMNDIDRLGSTVVHLGNNLAATESEIVNMGLRIAGAGNQIGLTEAQILSFAGALSSLGIRAEMGGSAISKVMLNMNTAVKSGGTELEAFAKVAGMSAQDFADAFEQDASKAILAFVKGLDDINQSGGDVASTLKDLGLGEIRVRDTLMRLAGGSEVLAESLELGNTAWKENSALVDEAQKRYETFASKLKILWNRLKDIVLIIGTPLMEVLSDLIDALNPALSYIEELAAKFENASDRTKRLVAGFVLAIPILASIATVFFGILAVIGLAVAAFGFLTTTATTLGISLSTLLGIVGALTGIAVLIPVLTVLATTIISRWDEIKERTNVFVDNVKSKLNELPSFLQDTASRISNAIIEFIPQPVLNLLESAVDTIRETLFDIGEAFEAATQGDFTKLGELAAKLLPTIIGVLMGGIPGLIIAGSRFLPAISEGITKNIGSISEAANNIITNFLNGVNNYLPKVLEAGVQIIENILMGVVSAVPLILEAVTQLITTIIEAIAMYLPMLIEAGVTILTTLLQGLAMALPILIQSLTTVIQTMVIAISALLPLIIQSGIEILLAIITGIVQALPLIIETVVTLVTTLLSTIIELLPIILDAGIQLVLALIQGIVESLPLIIQAVVQLVNALLNTILDNLPLIIDAGIKVLLSLVDGIVDALPNLIQAAVILILSLSGAIIANLPKIIKAGIDILIALVLGIIDALPQLINAALTLIIALASAIISNLPKIIAAGVQILLALIKGIIQILPQLVRAGWELVVNLASSVVKNVPKMLNAGVELINGLIRGVGSMAGALARKAREVASGALNAIKRFFGIRSPSRIMRKEVGQMIGLGIIRGMDDEINAIKRMAMELSEAAKPEMPKLADFEVGGMNAYADTLSTRLQAEVSHSDSYIGSILNDMRNELRIQSEELRKQKQMIIEMDGRQVGKAVEPYVTEKQEFSRERRERFRG